MRKVMIVIILFSSFLIAEQVSNKIEVKEDNNKVVTSDKTSNIKDDTGTDRTDPIANSIENDQKPDHQQDNVSTCSAANNPYGSNESLQIVCCVCCALIILAGVISSALGS